ncbi:MAG: hypothetical protein JSV42_02250 [Chloroflexota bacterium]|nr:MAG: hypothetical protein JSV42_02250 [Chloroflexota bacterium]
MKKSFWIAIAILGALLIPFLFLGKFLLGNWNNLGWGMMGGWPAGTMHGWGFGSIGWLGMILMWLIAVGFIVLVILGVIGLVRGFSNWEGGGMINKQEKSQSSPREILQIRFAKGDITRDQYLKMLDDIE